MSYAAAKGEEGKIRIRFENLSKRLSKIDVDIIHKKTDSFSLLSSKVTPDSGELGCFFMDEIDRLRTIDTAPPFKKLCYELGLLSQSLPELLHHQLKVIALLVQYMKEQPAHTLRSIFSLVSVLGRDLKEDMNPHFHTLFGALVGVVPSVAMSGGTTPNDCIPNPELTGKLFETISHLLRANLKTLLEQPDELSAYYGALLGNSVEFVRKFAAKSLVLVFRKLSTSVFKLHAKKLLKAVSQNFKSALQNDLSLLLLDDYEQLPKDKLNAGVRRTKCLLEGLSLLFFYTFKGIRGQAHSKASKRVQAMYQLLLALLSPKEEEGKDDKGANKKKKASAASSDDVSLCFTVKCYGAILFRVQSLFHRHLFWQTQGEVLNADLDFLQQCMQAISAITTMSVSLKNVLAEMSGKLLFMLLTIAQGRVLKDEAVKQQVMSRVLDLAMQMTKWTRADSQIVEETVAVAQNVLIRAWHLYPQNTVFSARCAELLTPALDRSLVALSAQTTNDEKLKETALLRYTDGFVHQLPGAVVGRCVLPVLSQGLLSLKAQLQYDEWIALALQFLFRIKDFRENTDDFLQLRSSEENDNAEEEEEEEEDDLSDDDEEEEEDENNSDNDENPRSAKQSQAQAQKKAKQAERERAKKLKLLQTKKKDLKKKKKSVLRSGISEETARIADKHLYAINALPLLLQEIKTFLVKELKKKNAFSGEFTAQTQSKLSLSLLAVSWFGKCLPDIVIGTETENQLLASFSDALKKIHGELDVFLAKEGAENVLYYLLHAFATVSAKKVSSAQGGDVRAVLLQWIKALSECVQRRPASIRTLSSFSFLAQSFHENIPDTPKDFLSQVFSAEEGVKIISSLAQACTSPSFWLRVYAVRVLGFLSSPVDEMTSFSREHASAGAHVFDVAGLLMEILRLPIHLSQEREILRRLEVLEVWCRGEKLLAHNAHFVRVIIGFSLGLFHVKFKSIWAAAVAVLHSIASSSAGEEMLWPMFCAAFAKAQVPPAERAAEKVFVYSKDRHEEIVLAEDVEQWDLRVCLSALAERNSGESAFSPSVMHSLVFPVRFGGRTKQLAVQPDARTDQESVCLMLFELLKKTPGITLKRSKTIVPAFLSFLENQYYRAFAEEPELVPLTLLGLFRTKDGEKEETNDSVSQLLPNRAIRQRLEAFLSIFAAVPSPKQLFKHNLLFALFHELVCKPDLVVAKLAFDCIATYKPLHVTPYKDNIKRIFDDKTLRNELLVFVIDRKKDEASAEQNEKETIVKEEHKSELFPLLIRILFGRLLAKPATKRGGDRDQNVAKRSAVLSFIAKMDGSYAQHFLHLMMRGILLDYLDVEREKAKEKAKQNTDIAEDKAVLDYLANGYAKLSAHVTMCVAKNGFRRVSWERFQGFLFLLKPVISLLGFRLTQYVPVLQELLMQMFVLAHSSREKSLEELRDAEDVDEAEPAEEDEGEAEGEEVIANEEEGEAEEDDNNEELVKSLKLAKFSSAVRSMVLSRFAEMIEIFHSVSRFEAVAERLFAETKPLLVAMKSAVVGARKLPALLALISQLAMHSGTVRIVVNHAFVLEQIIQCVSVSTLFPEIGKTIFAVLTAVLDVDKGKAMEPYAEMIVDCFTRRFQGKTESSSATQTELKLSDVVVSNIGGARIELQLLCRLAEEIFVRKEITISTLSASNLATLVLGLLRGYTNSRKTRVMDDWVINILRIYKSLLWRIEDVSNHTVFFSRLFGPTQHSASLFNQPTVRQELVTVFKELASHRSVCASLSVSLSALHGMTKPDGSILESRDYGTFIPVMQALSRGPEEEKNEKKMSWSCLLGPHSYARRENKSRAISWHVSLCAAPVFEMVRCLYDNELAVRSATVPALKALISSCVHWYERDHCEDWLSLLTSILVPALRKGVQSSSDNVKSGFLALLSHLVRTAQGMTLTGVVSCSESFHRDLGFLLNEDPEQDFFENIAHIQLHRRARAFTKLKLFLQNQFAEMYGDLDSTKRDVGAQEQEEQLQRISTSSFVHVLLPIAFHYLTSNEFNKKLNQNLLHDVVQFVSAVALHLPWNHYLSLFKRTLKALDRANESKEKLMQSVLCGVLDSFRFDIATSLNTDKAEGEKNKVASQTEEEVEETEENEQEEDQEEVQKDASDEKEKEEEEQLEADAGEIAAETVKDERTIASIVVKSVLPAVKVHLIKTVKDHNGDKTQTVQSHIALALTNLIKRLEPPAVSPQLRANLFTNLVISIVNTLKSKDSSIRDAARHCLAKMVTILGMNTLRTVVYELQSILREGYQKHVSLYTVKYILYTILENYTPDTSFPSMDLEEIARLSPEELVERRPSLPALDEAIPLIMQSVLDDISEETKQDREAEGGIRSNVIREMKGSKFNEILEIIARCLLFRPTYALLSPEDPSACSSIHAVSSPLLQALHQFYEQNYFGNTSTEHFQTLSGRIAEALQRVAQGVAKNPSVKDKELLLYLHATLQPFVVSMMADYRRYKEAIGEISLGHAVPAGRSEKKKKRLKAAAQPGVGGSSSNLNAVIDEGEGDEDDFELDLPSYLRGDDDDDEEDKFESERHPKKRARANDAIRRFKAAQWLPREWRNSTAQDANERKAVLALRDREAAAQFKVQDGASAPRLTGRNRYDLVQQKQRTASSGIDKSTLIAIKFCLTLLHSSLKKGVFSANNEEIQSMLLPFVPLLRSFLYIPGASEVVALSVKCIGGLIAWGLRIEHRVFAQLTNRILLLMLQSGKAMVTKDNELCQACLQALVVCFKRYNESSREFEAKKATTGVAPEFPLNELKVRVLVEMMTVSMMEITSNYQHPAFHLIKEIICAKIVLPEIYDLVQTLTEQIVLSHRKGIREMASSIAVQFMLVYPMAKPRFESHLQLCLKNVSYEFDEGRMSALETLLLLIKSFPVPVIEEYAHMLFLPMTLKLVNEKVHRCREVVVQVLIALMKKIQSKELLTKFQDFSVKWLHSLLSFKATQASIAPAQEKQSMHNAISLMKVGAQVVGIFFKARPDLWSGKVEYIREVIAMVHENVCVLLQSYKQSSENKHSLENAKGGEMEETDAERIARVSKSDIATGHWNAFYHLLLLVDTLYARSPGPTDNAVSLVISEGEDAKGKNKKKSAESQSFMKILLGEMLLFPHVWVRSVSLRILESYFRRRPITSSGKISPFDDAAHCEVLQEKNMLYHIGRRLAIVLNQQMLPAALEESAIQATLYILCTMIAHPELDMFTGKSVQTETEGADEEDDLQLDAGEDGMEDQDEIAEREDDDEEGDSDADKEKTHKAENKYLSIIQKNHELLEKENDSEDDDEEDGSDDEEERESETNAGETATSTKSTEKRGFTWMIHRLRAIGADIRGNRRRHVLKVFHALVKAQNIESLVPYLPQIVEVPVRIMLSRIIVEENAEEEKNQTLLKEEATELLRHVENKMGAIEFMSLFSEIQRKVEKIKHDKKRRMKAEAVSNPALYAQKKMKKHEQKKFAQKRKVAKHMAIKGLKRRHSSD